MSDRIVYCRGVLCVVDAAFKWHAEKSRGRSKHDPEWEPTDAERKLYAAVSDLLGDIHLADRPAYGSARSRLQLPQLEA